MSRDLEELHQLFRAAGDGRGTGAALLLGPEAGRGLWHGDVVGKLKYDAGCSGEEWPAIYNAFDGAINYRERVTDAFALDITDAGQEALELLGRILERRGGPRVYWSDPLINGVGSHVPGSNLVTIHADEMTQDALKERLRGADAPMIDIFGYLITRPVPSSRGEAHLLTRQALVSHFSNHSAFVAWGWTSARDALLELRPTTVAQPMGFLVPRNSRVPAYASLHFRADGVGEEEEAFVDQVLDFLRAISPDPPSGTPRSNGSSPARGPAATPSATDISCRALLDSIADALFGAVHEAIEGDDGHVGIVVRPASVRWALAKRIASLQRATTYRINAVGDLQQIDSILHLAPVPSMVVVDSTVEIPEAETRSNTDVMSRVPRHVYLMPSSDQVWTTAGHRIVTVSGARVVAAVDTTMARLLDGVDPALLQRLSHWIVEDENDVGLQWRLHVLSTTLGGAAAADSDSLVATISGFLGQFATRFVPEGEGVSITMRPRQTSPPPAGEIRLSPRRTRGQEG